MKIWEELDLYDLAQVASELETRAPEDIAFLAVFYGAHLAAAVFALRTLVIQISRWFGLNDPAHYHKWPRVPWRTPYRIWLKLKVWYERVFKIGKHSTGGFAGVLATLTLLFKPGQVLLGRASAFDFGLLMPVGINVQRHLFMYAMTGTGKTTALISIISSWLGSAFIIDPKGQIVRALSKHDWRHWVVIDPYNITDAKTASINFFDCIKDAMKRDGDDAAVLWATRISEATIITPSGSKTPYFTDLSRQFFAGLILLVLRYHPEHEHNLPYVRDLIVSGYSVTDENGIVISKPAEAHALLYQAMMQCDDFGGVIKGAASSFSSAGKETTGNLRSTLQEQTKFLDIPAIRKILMTTSMPLSDLKTRDDVVLAFAAPVFSIREELKSFTRLLTNMLAYTFEAIPEKKGQCLCVIDELPSQGHNETLEVMLAVARSYGITFLGISQNTELMQKHYPKSWKSFSGEADAVFWMGGNHPDSAQHLSMLLGKKTIVTKDRYTGEKRYREVQAMDADQVKRFLDPNSDNLIVTRAGGRALKLKNEPYFKALPVWKYAPDPDHKEALLRRLSRKLFDRTSLHETPVIEADDPELDISEIFTPEPEIFQEEPASEHPLPNNVIEFPGQKNGGDHQ